MSGRCREINQKGKFCGKNTVNGSGLCKKHYEDLEKRKQARKDAVLGDFQPAQTVARAHYSMTSITDDPKRKVVFTKNVERHNRTDTENMIALGKKK